MRSLKSLGRLTKGRVIHKNTRNLWVATLHCCEEVERMRKTTNTNRQSNQEPKEIGRSRCQRYHEDLLKFIDWLKQFDPFNIQDKGLRSPDSGLVAKECDAINCHKAEEVGKIIQEKIDFKCFTNATIETRKNVKILLPLTKGIVVGNQVIHVDPKILFMQLIVLVERSKNTVNCFAYELISYPTSLF